MHAFDKNLTYKTINITLIVRNTNLVVMNMTKLKESVEIYRERDFEFSWTNQLVFGYHTTLNSTYNFTSGTKNTSSIDSWLHFNSKNNTLSGYCCG